MLLFKLIYCGMDIDNEMSPFESNIKNTSVASSSNSDTISADQPTNQTNESKIKRIQKLNPK